MKNEWKVLETEWKGRENVPFPLSGETVLVYDEQHAVVVAHYIGSPTDPYKFWMWVVHPIARRTHRTDFCILPSHWMPLPEPPTSSQ